LFHTDHATTSLKLLPEVAGDLFASSTMCTNKNCIIDLENSAHNSDNTDVYTEPTVASLIRLILDCHYLTLTDKDILVNRYKLNDCPLYHLFTPMTSLCV
jgi:hypothetical protein